MKLLTVLKMMDKPARLAGDFFRHHVGLHVWPQAGPSPLQCFLHVPEKRAKEIGKS